jgi:hypothetical protein
LGDASPRYPRDCHPERSEGSVIESIDRFLNRHSCRVTEDAAEAAGRRFVEQIPRFARNDGISEIRNASLNSQFSNLKSAKLTMPLLKREPDLFPADLFDLPEESRPWSVAYVRSRQEKLLARYLVQKEIPFYLPQIEKKIVTKVSSRSARSGRETSQAGTDDPTGHDLSAHRLSPLASAPSPAHRLSPLASRPETRLRLSYSPLFTGYVFLRHTLEERLAVLQSDVIVSLLEVADQRGLAGELGQLRDLQAAGASLVPHPWIGVGDAVKITDGSFKGYRGLVVKEHGRERLVVSIDLIRQSVAVEFERDVVSPDLFPQQPIRVSAGRARSRF